MKLRTQIVVLATISIVTSLGSIYYSVLAKDYTEVLAWMGNIVGVCIILKLTK